MGRKTYGRPFTPSSLCFLAGRDDNVFVAGGNNAVQVWTFDPDSRKLDNEYVGLGKLKRNIKNMMVRVRALEPLTFAASVGKEVYIRTSRADFPRV